tara:strand:- start:2 stop:301 length:300 start_codon:yes stop_codon:yes gene_type:complete
MNDLEICKRIAEIEGVETYISSISSTTLMSVCKPCNPSDRYNPLTNDELCFQLMIKYRIELFEVGRVWYCSWSGSTLTTSDTAPKKAICLAIIEVNKGK